MAAPGEHPDLHPHGRAYWILRIGERFGVPTLIALILLAFGGMAARWVGLNVVQPLTQHHLAFMDKVATAVEEQKTAVQEQKEFSKQLVGTTSDIANTQKAIIKLVEDSKTRDGDLAAMMRNQIDLNAGQAAMLKELAAIRQRLDAMRPARPTPTPESR